jgi:hypothetical protein
MQFDNIPLHYLCLLSFHMLYQQELLIELKTVFNELPFFNKSIPFIGYSGFVNAIEAMIPVFGAIS